MSDWQDLMIEEFGKTWVTREYNNVDIFRMAERVVKLRKAYECLREATDMLFDHADWCRCTCMDVNKIGKKANKKADEILKGEMKNQN